MHLNIFNQVKSSLPLQFDEFQELFETMLENSGDENEAFKSAIFYNVDDDVAEYLLDRYDNYEFISTLSFIIGLYYNINQEQVIKTFKLTI